MRSKMWRLFAVFLVLALLAGCGEKSSPKTNTNMVFGFLFSFDQRAETVSLASQMKKRQYPVQVTWCYDPEGGAETTMIRESEDEKKIQAICQALANAIILDNSADLRSEAPYYIVLTLADGSECRFEFVSESVIRLSEQNYSIESDGNLWPLLSEE